LLEYLLLSIVPIVILLMGGEPAWGSP
jgi:hypothetical protein